MRETVTLGLRLLFHDKRRLFAMSSSVAVGVVIMFLQLGLLQGILDAQALVTKLVRGDLLVMNLAREDLHHWDTVPRFELARIAATPGVAKVIPVYEDHVGFKDPDDNRVRRMIVWAFPPDSNPLPLAVGNSKTVSAALQLSSGFLYDGRSRPIFGQIRPGMNIEIDKFPLTVQGLAHMGPDIINDGNIFMSEGEWLARKSSAEPIMAVVRLTPSASVKKTQAAILDNTAGDVIAITPREARDREIASTLKRAPIGILFGVGVVAGMIIGAINGYQVLYAEVSDQLDQLATLKAVGFSDGFLNAAVMVQALALAGAGFLVGTLVALALDGEVAALTRLPIHIKAGTAVLVGVANALSCIVAGRLAARRIEAADPAALF